MYTVYIIMYNASGFSRDTEPIGFDMLVTQRYTRVRQVRSRSWLTGHGSCKSQHRPSARWRPRRAHAVILTTDAGFPYGAPGRRLLRSPHPESAGSLPGFSPRAEPVV